jgi:cell division transport system permease protein
MAQFGKASARRSKPSYIYSIVGVALILLIMGIMGWVFLNFSQVSKALKEDVRISVYLRTLNNDSVRIIQNYIEQQPYAKNVTFVDKEKAKTIWNKENNEAWDKILDYNPLPESIDFYAPETYVNKDSLALISNDILSKFQNQVNDLTYPKNLVSSLDEKAKSYGLIFVGIAALLCILVIISIDNTIRLAMFSNRFLIKTMQMVGATRWFIVKPMDLRAILNGAISATIAGAALFGLMQWAESWVPQLKVIRNNELTILLFGGLLILGVLISLVSTHRSVMKYLKMKLDDLY